MMSVEDSITREVVLLDRGATACRPIDVFWIGDINLSWESLKRRIRRLEAGYRVPRPPRL